MKENIKLEIENDLYKEISLILEAEYTIDKFENVVYKEGGRKRALDKIKSILNEYEEKHNIPQKEIRKHLIDSYASMQNNNSKEYVELSFIFDDIEAEEQVEKDIREGNIEKYERNI